ncbi:MAG: FtsX-like permease family protein [Thermoplasmata archaeon]|nr:FtsX-like permease family protein [Thermoplasmata archaeon]
MALDPTVATLLLLLVVVGAILSLLAVRHRLSFRIAIRNVRRGRARTALLIAGLLVGTTIISGSLVVGDSVQQLGLHYTYLGVGYTDEAIYGSSAGGAFPFFPYSAYTQASALLAGHSAISGITPEIISSGSAFDRTSGVPETNLNLIGVNGNQSASLGAFEADNGSAIAGPAPAHVLIDDQTANALNASAGESLLIFAQSGLSADFTVQAVVQENLRGAFITAGLSPGNMFIDLADAQQLENASGQINYIAVTNSGSQSDGASASSSVSAYLNATLAPVLAANALAVHTPLADGLSSAVQSSQSLVTIFLVLGLFSIAAGAMLIIGIFVMLAEERKGEMGMLRAIGLRRRDLVYAYLFEGAIYAAGSALAGTLTGLGVGYFLVYLAGFILSGTGIPANAVVQSFTVTQQSLVIAYVAGFLLTLITVVVACRRASRLNIVRAIRDIPEPRPPVRTYTFLAYVGGVVLVLGVLLFLASYRGSSDYSLPITGGAMAVLGAGFVAARFLRNRLVFSAVGVALLVWAGFEPLHTFALGTSHTGGIFIVFVEGIIMVGGALIAFLFNGPQLAQLLTRMLGRNAESSPVVRVALSYPTRQPSRTAVSLTIFALVVFTMVATASFGATVEANLQNTVSAQSGGYSFFGFSQVPIPDLAGQIANNSTLAPLFATSVALVTGAIHVTVPGFASNPFSDSLYSASPNATATTSFYTTNQFSFTSTWHDTSAAQTFQEIAGNGSFAIVDQGYSPVTSSVSGGPSGPPHPTLQVGTVIQVASPDGARSANVTVVGILKESVLTGVWVNPGVATHLGDRNATAYLLTVRSGVSTTHAAQEAKIAFFRWDLILFDIQALLASSISTTEGFIGLLEIFVGLGLGVGIAAMGILALRAVVERRREIGMLRASGFTQGMILRTLVLEYSFVTLLGVGIGAVLGLLIVFNLTTSPSAAASGITSFSAPWATVAEIVIVAYLLVLVAIAGPALRAARLPPADAVRATE